MTTVADAILSAAARWRTDLRASGAAGPDGRDRRARTRADAERRARKDSEE